MTIKTIAAFLNSRDAETCSSVLVTTVLRSAEFDYASLRKPDKNDRDLFQQHLCQCAGDRNG